MKYIIEVPDDMEYALLTGQTKTGYWSQAIEFSELEKAEPHWIPVTENTLPQLNRVVVVCGDKGTWDVGRYRGYSEITGHENINLWNWKNKTFKKVYWWMYKEDALPEPTREVTE
jgi:hypothetical protein